jgi:selenide, water dikinase
VITIKSGQPGDVLFLTKPLGTGVICTAMKFASLSDQSVQRTIRVYLEEAMQSMVELNDKAAQVARMVATACTDVSGFGLLGHVHGLAAASQTQAELYADAIPALSGSQSLLEAGHTTGGGRRNLQWADSFLKTSNASAAIIGLLADPQTSGGLLFACPSSHAAAAKARASELGVSLWEIGRLEGAEYGREGTVILS